MRFCRAFWIELKRHSILDVWAMTHVLSVHVGFVDMARVDWLDSPASCCANCFPPDMYGVFSKPPDIMQHKKSRHSNRAIKVGDTV